MDKVKSYGYRSLSTKLAIKDVDMDGRTVSGYFAATGIVDSDGDLIQKGSFAKSIADRGPGSSSNRKIAHLAFHDTRRPIGVLSELKEDDHGLLFESGMATHTDGEDSLKMYDSGLIREHSIGFNYLPDHLKWIDIDPESKDGTMPPATEEGLAFMEAHGGYWVVDELKLWEGSYVTFGANSETPSFGVVKSVEDKIRVVKEINDRMDLLIKETARGTYSDNVFPMLEAELAYLKESYNSLLTEEPSLKDALKKEPKGTPTASIGKSYLHSLINNQS